MIIGGQAVLVHGEPRMTKDIDVTLGIGVEEIPRVERVVESLGLEYLVKDVEGFVKETMVLPVREKDSGIRVDFIFSFSPYEKQAIERAIEVKLGRVGVKFASLEDVVIHKVAARRARDIEDVRSILLKNPEYDGNYIKKWLSGFDEALGGDFSKTFEDLLIQIKKGA
jgi:hypothetical protein